MKKRSYIPTRNTLCLLILTGISVSMLSAQSIVKDCTEKILEEARIALFSGKNSNEVLKQIQPCLDRIIVGDTVSKKLSFSLARRLGQYPRDYDSIPESLKSRMLQLGVSIYSKGKGSINHEKAKKYFLELLKRVPNFQPHGPDSLAIVVLFNKYRPMLNSTVNFHVGMNFPLINILNEHSLDNTDIDGESYTPGPSFSAGFGVDKILKDLSWRIGLEFSFSQRNFSSLDRLSTAPEKEYFSTLNYTERQSWLDGNIIGKYKHDFKNSIWSLQWQVGMGANLLSRARLIGLNRLSDLAITQNETEAKISKLRKKWNYSPLIGFRFEHKVRLNTFFIELRYQPLLRNMANTQQRYEPKTELNTNLSNADLIGKYGYVSNDFFLHNASIIAGFSFHAYRREPKLRNKNKNENK